MEVGGVKICSLSENYNSIFKKDLKLRLDERNSNSTDHSLFKCVKAQTLEVFIVRH